MAIDQPSQREGIKVISPAQIEQNFSPRPAISQQALQRIIARALEAAGGERAVGGDADRAIVIYGNRSQYHFLASPLTRISAREAPLFCDLNCELGYNVGRR